VEAAEAEIYHSPADDTYASVERKRSGDVAVGSLPSVTMGISQILEQHGCSVPAFAGATEEESFWMRDPRGAHGIMA
jgi:hypothetical protein